MTSQPITPLVLSTEAILRLAAGHRSSIKPASVLAALGGDAANIRRDLRRLRDAGLVTIASEGQDGTAYDLTGEGYDAVAALDRAAGAAGPAGEAQAWPHAGFVPNPDQPRKSFPADMIRDLAESIVQVGGLLHNMVAYPADASGARMIHDGECRWRACGLLIEEDRLPDSLKLGLPFTEREGTELEMLKVALVANHQRGDLAPWEDARGLHRVKVLTGLSARGVAMLVGRAKEGSERGVKDVQEKIRAVERASAEDIALHEAGELSWEKLRDNIREARTLSPHAALAMAELRWKVERDGRHPDDDIDTCWVLSDGQGDRWGSHRELVEARLIETTARLLNGILSPLVKITEQGVAWLNKAAPLAATRLAAGDDDQALDYLRSGWGQMEGAGPSADLDEGFVTPWLNAKVLQEQIERRRAGLPDRDPEVATAPPEAARALDEEPGPWRQGDDHEIWVRKRLRHALGSIKPRDLLAVVELADACHFKPYGKARPGFTRTWSYGAATGRGKPQALISDYGCGGQSGGGEPELSHVHPATLEWLTDNGLFKPEGGGARSAMLYRVRQGVSQSGADQCEVTGRYHTSWLNPPAEPNAASKVPAILNTPAPQAGVSDLSAKQILLLAELADFRWRWSAGDHLPAGPHGGAHGLDKTLPVLVAFTGPGGREGYRLTQAGVKELKELGLDSLTHIDGGVRERAGGAFLRSSLLQRVREAVINPAKASAFADGEYVTPWLNTETAKRVAEGYRARLAEQARIAEFDTIVDAVLMVFTSRVHGVVGMAASKRDWAGEPAVDPREIPELADLVVSEMMSGNPYVACGHLAMIQMKVVKADLNTIAADAAVTEAVKRWKARRVEDDQVLLTLKVGGLVNNGGASDYRLVSRKDHHDSRVFDFIVQPILNGKDHGGVRALNLNQIQRLGGHNTKPPTPTALALQSGAPLPATEAAAEMAPKQDDDPERDAVNQDEYRAWIAEALATNHQADPEAAPGFAIEALEKQTGDIKFLATPGTWRRADAAFDAADWAAENLLAGLRVEPEDQSQIQGEEADVVA